MSKIKWAVLLFLGVLVAVPAYALELSLGTYPSWFRIRARVFENATFQGLIPENLPAALDPDDRLLRGNSDDIFFVDSRLLVSPILRVNDKIAVQTQFDIFSNFIWGGLTNVGVGNKVFQAGDDPNTERDFQDSFRGAFLTQVNGLEPDEKEDYVQARMMYLVAQLPAGLGTLEVGRQPFPWGMGILGNSGSQPDQDFGTIVERFKHIIVPFANSDSDFLKRLVFVYVFDRNVEGLSVSNLNQGDGWDDAVALIYVGDSLLLGGYIFPTIYQNNVSGGLFDFDPATLWSVLLTYRDPGGMFDLAFELQDTFGNVNDCPVCPLLSPGNDELELTAGDNILMAGRFNFYPPVPFIKNLSVEGGWDQGRSIDELQDGDFGGAFPFNAAYTIDNLLFKNMIPSIYGIEGGVINAFYFRGWTTLALDPEHLFFTPQVIFAWSDETDPFDGAFNPIIGPGKAENDRFLGVEIEGTITWKIAESFWLDLIGSVVIPSGGIDDLLEARACIEATGNSDCIFDGGVLQLDDPPDAPFAFQGRFVVALDPLIKDWFGSGGGKP